MELGRRIGILVMSLVVMVSLAPAPAPAMAGSYEIATVQSSTSTATLTGVGKAKVSKKKVRARYKAVLRDAARGKGQFAAQYRQADSSAKRYWKSDLKYAVHDVDKNGTPELLVRAGSYTFNTCWHMFTVSGKQARYLGSFGRGQLMRGRDGGLYVWDQRQGYRWLDSVAIQYGKVHEQMLVNDSGEFAGFPQYRQYAKSKGLKALKTSPVTSYKLLRSKVK